MKRILVVEDDKDIIELVRYNLEKDGYQVGATGDGATGLGSTQENSARSSDSRPDASEAVGT